FPEALCGRGRMQATIGAWPAAKESAEKALALKADVAEGQILRARLLKESGETAAAFEATLLGRKLSPLDAGVQSSAARLANYIRGPLWAKTNTHESAHYAVRSNLPVARCKQYAEFLEAMRPHYEEVLGRPLPAGKKAEILVFESQEGYFVYNDYTAGGRMEHTLGAFTPWHAQIALFEGVETQETLRTLAHEGFHQAVLSIAPDVPIWFNEGMAEYVGAARVDKGAVVERGGIQVGRLENLKSALKYGWQPFPFAKLFLDTKADFYGDDAPLRYAQAWGMVRFFMDGDAGRWRPVMKDYIDRILKGETARAAYEATFSKQDAPLMEAGWLKHSGLTSRSSSVLAKDPPPPTAPVMTAMSVDLLALLKKNPIPAGNGWTLKSGILESSRVVVSSLGIGQDPPPEYDWTLSVRRLGGQGPLLLGLQGGGSTFVLRLDDAGTSRIEKVDGPDKANAPSVRPGPALPVGKTAVVICSVRKTGVTVKLDGETLLTWNGDLKNLIYAPDPDMIAACQSLFLFTKETGFQILKMTVATPAGAPGVAAKTPIPGAKTPPGKSIPLDADIRRWVSDEEGRQVMALDTSQNLLLISLPERRVVKKVPAGPGPTCLFPTAGFKSAWVGGGGTIVRIDLEKGEIVESIPTAYAAEAMAVVRKMAYVLTSGSEIRVVDLSEKKDLGGIGDSFSSALGYDGRRERLWGLWSGSLVEYDLPKAGPLIKEQKKNLNDKERGDLTNALNAAAKRHPVTGQDTQLGPKIFLDDRIYRIFAGAVMVKTDSPEKVVGVFRSPAHSLDNDQSVRDFLGAYKGKLPIIAASADGRFAASVTHVFDMATFAVRQELPLPTSMVVFPKDSNDLYYYDWAQHAILVTRLEVK
ncbi:MAG TPA: hypothetical protein VE981_06765, partial [Planctomycetota bacterium]|nr:hypothetical protein [Planctomycetota bacterium]